MFEIETDSCGKTSLLIGDKIKMGVKLSTKQDATDWLHIGNTPPPPKKKQKKTDDSETGTEVQVCGIVNSLVMV